MKKNVYIVLTACGATMLCISQVFASSPSYTGMLSQAFDYIYSELRGIAWGGGLIGLCSCAIGYFIGDDSKAKKALTGAGYVLLALFAIYLLGTIADFAESKMFGGLLKPWDPHDPWLGNN